MGKKIIIYLAFALLFITTLSFQSVAGGFNKLPQRNTFDCSSTCSPISCSSNLEAAAYCAAWCSRNFQGCWKGASESINFYEKLKGQNSDVPAAVGHAQFIEKYQELSELAQRDFQQALNLLQTQPTVAATEEAQRIMDKHVLKELQDRHHEKQKERAGVLSAGLQIVP